MINLYHNQVRSQYYGTSLITRKRIAQAFIQILQEKEFEKISVSNIMERAGIRDRHSIIISWINTI